MKQFHDDELIDIPMQPRQAAPRQQQQPQQPQPPEDFSSGPASSPQPQHRLTLNDDVPVGPQAEPRQQPKAGDACGEEVGWGDRTTMRMGDGLERIRPDEGSDKAVRFALLPFLRPRRARVHWVLVGTGKSPRLCLAQGDAPGWCCTRPGEEGRYRVVVLALCYTNANPKGGYTKLPDGSIPPIAWKVRCLDLSPSNYRKISELPEDDASPYDYAMSMVNTRYEISIKTRALWKADPEVCKAVADGGVKLGRKLGKKMSLGEWKTLLSGAAPSSDASLDDMGDLQPPRDPEGKPSGSRRPSWNAGSAGVPPSFPSLRVMGPSFAVDTARDG